MKGLKVFSLSSIAIAALMLYVPAAKADSFSITFISPDQSAVAGNTVEFDAIITNLDPTSELYLNNDNIASLDSPLSLYDSAFWAIPYPLSPAGSPGDSYTGELFTVLVPLGTSAGTYEGEFDLLGGSNGDDNNLLGADDFTITVENTAVPEPSSLLLLASGLAGLAGTLRRRLIR